MATNKISIIIPSYNRASIISQTLESIQNQSYENWECIIVDDGSTDDTLRVLQEWKEKDSRFSYLKRPLDRHKGPNACRNYGFENCHGEYVYFFDSDDLLITDALFTYIKAFDGNNLDVVVAPLEKIDLETNESYGTNKVKSCNLLSDYYSGEIAFYVCGPMWKKSFLDKQGCLFDEKIRNLDDWDFNLRMLYCKPKISYIDTPLIKYRHHPNSLKKELGKVNIEEIKSAITAKERHLKLLKEIAPNNYKNVEKNYIDYLKALLRVSALKRDKSSFDILKKIKEQRLESKKFLPLLKVYIGFTITYTFKRGAKLI